MNSMIIFWTSLGFCLGFLMATYVLEETLKKTYKNFTKHLNKSLAFKLITATITSVLFLILSSQFESVSFLSLLILLAYSIGFAVLVYLSIHDYTSLSIPLDATAALLIALIIINLLVIAFLGLDAELLLWPGNQFIPVQNLVMGIVGASFIGSIVLVTKGKGMGTGDIILAGIMGLSLGMYRFVVAFYITILTASLVGIILAIRKKKFKGVKLAFVPFISLGIIATILFWNQIAGFIEEVIFRA